MGVGIPLPLMPAVGATAPCIGETGMGAEDVGMPPVICEMGVTGMFDAEPVAPEKPRPAPRSRRREINRPMSLFGSTPEKNPPPVWLNRLMPDERGGGGGAAGPAAGGGSAGGCDAGGGGGVGSGLVISPGGSVV